MQVFELHFNPKNKEDKIFESFVYEPETAPEKKLGSLYMVGELSSALPRDSRFLDQLASVVKNEFYGAGLQKSGEQSLKKGLEKANQYLEKESRSGNVNWLGNLHFAILNFNDLVLNFTKVGGVKILLCRDGEFLDIGHNLEFQDVDPYPSRVFGNVALGKLAPTDKIIVLTKDLFSLFSQEGGFLNRLKDVSNEKDLKKILKMNRPLFKEEARGICLVVFCGAEYRLKQASEKARLSQKRPSFFVKFPKLPSKNKLMIAALSLILMIGFLIFNPPTEENPALTENKKNLELAKSKISMAENFLIFQEKEKAKELLLEAQTILSSLIEQNSPLKQEAVWLQETVQKYLREE